MPNWWWSAQPAAQETTSPAAQPAPIPVAQATPVQPPPPPPQAAPRVTAPNVPLSFPDLRSLGEAELQQLSDSRLVQKDWISNQEGAVILQSRIDACREENRQLAQDILASEAEFRALTERRQADLAVSSEKRAKIEALADRRDEIMKHRSPAQMAAAHAQRAQDAEQAAEDMLQDVLDVSSTMDATELSAFRQRFMEHKSEKHWRLALKESILNGQVAA